ncbi:MAG: hypothetical protein PHP03_00330 [Candidatus Pacebacteria bacterium]|nr:hypothetical protein [Candidatus Paceibacterota bacterium]
MYDFILQIFVMSSLAIMIYMVARNIPRVSEVNISSGRKNRVSELFERIPWHKFDAFVNSMSEKSLRKLKLFLLKADNSVNRQLKKFKSSGEKEISKPDIFSQSSSDSIEQSQKIDTIEHKE